MLLTLILNGSNANAQSIVTLRSLILPPQDSITIQDSFTIDPQSINLATLLTNKPITSFYIQKNKLQIFNSVNDSLKLIYRVIPIRYQYSFSLFDTNIITQYKIPDFALPDYYKKKKSKEEWWDAKSIAYSGTFSRGLSVGNAQSLVLNSNLNLQIQGDLGDGIKLTAAISDNQIPIQADGNTRQLNEFDRLYIQLEKNKTKLIVGDYELGKPTGYFQNYFKKTKGISISHEQNFGKWKSTNKASAAISKGKSNRMTIKTQNGNQGPYRLIGKDGENFIIILSGSEKLWWDGNLLVRGDDGDYTIDYNLAEVRFTARRIVTDVARIIIEFEYADQNYTRSLLNYTTEIKRGKTEFYFNFFKEQDSRQSAVQNDLDSLDKIKLQLGGDDSKSFFRSGAKIAGNEFSKNRVYYRQKDTLVFINGIPSKTQIYYYDPLPDSTALQVGFSEVGFNRGSYLLRLSNANGRVYEWVADDPVTGEKKGNYEPLIPIIPPVSFSIMSYGVKWTGTAEDYLNFEISNSNLDKNRLSTLQDNDNLGFAYRIDARSKKLQPFSKSHSLIVFSNYEWNDHQFRFIQPYRNPEFARDWNISSPAFTKDHYANLHIKNKIGNKIDLNITNSFLSKSNSFRGIQNGLQSNYTDSTQQINININLLSSKDSLESTQFFRPKIFYEKSISKKWKTFIQYSKEYNRRLTINEDTLKRSSFSFDEIETGLASQNNEEAKFKLQYKFRIDREPEKTKFAPFSNAHEITGNYLKETKHLGDFEIQISGRTFTLVNPKADSLNKNTLLGFVDHQIGLLGNALRLKNNYQISSGLEPRLEFIYEELRSGQGDYIYRDFNGDGIRQNQEFVYAPDVDSAQFVRIQLFNSAYYQVYQASWNNLTSFDLGQLKNLHNKFIKKLSLENVIRLNSKQSENTAFLDRLNPLYFLKNGSEVLSFQSYFNQNIYFNRANPIYDIQCSRLESKSRFLYISGNDERFNLDYNIRSRATIQKKFDVILNISQRVESQLIASYALQNFKINSTKVEPEIVYRYSSSIRFKLIGMIKSAKEQINGLEKGEIQQLSQELQISLTKKMALKTYVKYIKIAFDGKPGTPLEYSMLEGFKDGNNFAWDINLDYKINHLIQLNFGYSGRKTATSDPVHTGRAVMRALF